MASIGRYSITKRRKDVEREIASRLRVRLSGGDDAYERFNVAPTEEVPAIVEDRGGRRGQLLRWGLVPAWARQLNTGLTLINARAETVATSRVYSGLVERASHRCLVLADGFYEWVAAEDPKQPRVPLRFSLAGGASFCFASLWTTWRSEVASCSVLTTVANELVAPVHDRMPVVLGGPDEEAAWMQGGDLELLGPIASERTSVAPANPAVNKAGVEGPELLAAPAA
jgi:putative SOS response-associated peptidase YedK